jgi:ketosteroid isomerase-like protein
MTPAIRIGLGVLVVATFSCARTSFDAASEQKLLLERDAQWAQLAAANQDVEKIIAYWSDDAIVIPPGQPPIEGKDALRQFVTASQKIPGFRIHWVSDHVSFSPDGNVAYMRGANETTVTGPDGKPITIPGRGITVWRKGSDGQWRCVVDIWNEPPSAKPLPTQ